MTARRFPIAFERAYAIVSAGLLIFPSSSYVEIDGGQVSVRMGWAFRSTFERARVTGTELLGERVRFTRGVHGFNGRWLVNGAGDGVLVIRLAPPARGYVMGFPVRLREILVSVDEPSGLARALTG